MSVLIVDDNETNLDVISEILDESGYDVLFAKDGPSAIDRTQLALPDLILLDIMMPGMNGFEVCRILKSEPTTKNIPIIFMSALTDTVNVVKGFELGAVDYITKPVQSAEMLARVKTHLTLQRLLNRERELNDLKTKFLSFATHEFRTPLAAILMSSGILKMYGDSISPEKQVQHLERVEENVQQLSGLLDDVLAITRLESGNVRLKPKTVDMVAFCQKVIDEFRFLIDGTHTIEFEIKGMPRSVEIDPKLMHHILSNLISNAIKYSPTRTTVKFGLELNTNQIIIRVTDQGYGIPQTFRSRLFQPFQRADNIAGIKGTGLGLSIVKQFVELHSGTISVQSEVGHGSTFTVSIPLTTAI